MSRSNCETLWGSPTINPLTGIKFRARSPTLAKMIKGCVEDEWRNKEPCSVFRRFGEQFSPTGRRLQKDVRGKWHKKCSPLKRGRKPKKSPKKSPRKGSRSPMRPRSPSAGRRSPRRSPTRVSRSGCAAKGLGYRKASCISPRRSKEYGMALF